MPPKGHALPVIDRIMRRRVIVGECWIWTGATTSRRAHHDYGQVFLWKDAAGRAIKGLVHRIVYEELIGPIPGDLFVLHRCDAPRCFRPEHLFLGDVVANSADSVSKGRSVELALRGERHGNVILSDAQVVSIRERYAARGVSQCALAREFGVAQSVVSCIVRGQTWVHVGGPRTRAWDRKPFAPHPMSVLDPLANCVAAAVE